MIDYGAMRMRTGRARALKAAGDTVEGKVATLTAEPDPYARDAVEQYRARLYFTGSPKGIWVNGRLFDALEDANVQPGDTIRITRGPDLPATGGMHPPSTWTVERLGSRNGSRVAEVAEVAPAPAPVIAKRVAAGPSW